VLTFTEAVAAVGMDDRDAVYWAGRATLVRRPEDVELFDRAFAVFWDRRRSLGGIEEEAEPISLTLLLDDEDEDDAAGDDQAEDTRRRAADHPALSAVEVLRPKTSPSSGAGYTNCGP
jgi:uncharacterized protein with von Willebrand factor type A (vWA) domain